MNGTAAKDGAAARGDTSSGISLSVFAQWEVGSRPIYLTFIMALRATAAEPGLSEPPHSWTGSSITTFLLNRIEGAMKE